MAVKSRAFTLLITMYAMTGLFFPVSAAARQSWFAGAYDTVVRLVNLDAQKPAQAASPELDRTGSQQYYNKIVKDENSITIKGQVPSEGDLKILQGVVAATSPGATFTDRTRIKSNIADRENWLTAMTFALRQLAKLDNGVAVLNGNVLSLEGVTKVDDNFSVIQQKLKEEAPKGLILERVGVRPPEVRPFVWLADLQPGNLSLSGHVPDECDQAVVSYAKALFGHAEVKNTMASAVGAPENWIAAAKISLEMLTLLRQGTVTLQDKIVRIDGVLSASGLVETMRTYGERLPKGFRLETNVLEPAARLPSLRAGDLDFAVRSIPSLVHP